MARSGLRGQFLIMYTTPPHLLRRYRRRFRSPRVPIAKRSAIHLTVIVDSAHKRAANATFNGSPLGRVLRSASCYRHRFNSSA